MVGRLVKKEYVRLLHEELSKLYTHTPSSRELLCRTVKVATLESESYECALQFCVIVVTAHHHETVVLVCESFHEFHIFLALVVGT